jgi:hypothetical protein
VSPDDGLVVGADAGVPEIAEETYRTTSGPMGRRRPALAVAAKSDYHGRVRSYEDEPLYCANVTCPDRAVP